VRVVFNKLLKETKNLPDNVFNIADMIDVKGLKAQGNQVTKFKVKEITLNHEIDGGEPWPEDAAVVVEGGESNEEALTVEWDLDKKEEDDEDVQPSLFDTPEEE
jgi:topoisomerase-4 subunit A